MTLTTLASNRLVCYCAATITRYGGSMVIRDETEIKSETFSADGVALVTGGSGGIGAEIARRLAAQGALVAVTYFNSAPQELLDELGPSATAHRLDVRDPSACTELIASLIGTHGSIHTLVHAAGPHVPMMHLSTVDPAQFARQVEADLVGFFNIAHAALHSLRETRGSIVAVTSAATRRYPVRDGLSSAPKGGVEALAMALAAEEGRYGVRVNCVGPGMLVDGMAERLMSSGDLDERAQEVARSNIPLRRFGTARDIAEAVTFLASDRANFISGQKLDVDGGYGV